MHGHPSSFWFEEERLFLTVYVDDLILSGPENSHGKLWDKLRYGPAPIDIGDYNTYVINYLWMFV